MNTSHREDLLDSALEDSFPASDPVSVFTESPKPRDRVRTSDQNGIPWKKVSAVLPVVLGLAGLGVRSWSARKQRAVRTQQVQRLAGLVAATVVVSAVLAARAKWLARKAPSTPEDPDEYPLFV